MVTSIVLLSALALSHSTSITAAIPTLTGSINVVQGTLVGNYTGSNTPQTVSLHVTSRNVTLSYKDVILPGAGFTYDNTPVCLMLQGSQPVIGTSFASGKLFAWLFQGTSSATTATVPINGSGAMVDSLVVGGFNASNLELCLPSFNAAGVNFVNGMTFKWQALPISYSLPLNMGAGPTQGQVRLLAPYNPPVKVNIEIDGALGNNNPGNMVFTGAGSMSNVNVFGLCPGASTTYPWTGPAMNAEFDINVGP